MSQIFYCYSLILLLCFTYSLSLKWEISEILNEELSDEELSQEIGEELSQEFDEELNQEIEDNNQYDHNKYLVEEWKPFDLFSPEDSKIRLASIVDKMDTDKDGFVTHSELKTWIQHTQLKSYEEEVDNLWKNHVPPNKDSLAWADYRNSVYGFLDYLDPRDRGDYLYFKTFKRDKRRWLMADSNHDGVLSQREFGTFLHPEVSLHTRQALLIEAMEDMDRNEDGKVSLEEYIGHVYHHQEEKDEEPDWVRNEREQFYWSIDKNGNGFMDLDEAPAWIMPQVFHEPDAEARHLLSQSDSDWDGKLTKKEILDQYELFLASPATDFGDALTLVHDEF